MHWIHYKHFRTDLATFNFHEKIKIFENFQKSSKSLENPSVRAQVVYPGWVAAGRSEEARGAREVSVPARGGAVGVPESRNMSGMLPVMSLPIFTAIGGP